MTLQKKVLSVLLLLTIASSAFIGGIYSYSLFTYDFKTLNQQTFKHDDLQGSVVIINYFAEWCVPCLREIPELNEFYHQASDNVKLFAISYDAVTPEKLAQIKEKYNIEFPLISEIANDFSFAKPQYLPATFIIKPNGELAGQLLGEQTTQSLNEAVSAF